MGHGWKTTGSTENKRSCKCGKGEIFTTYDVEESDYPPFERVSSYGRQTTTCPDKCEKLLI